jgi:hypothetical protein
MSQQIQDIMRTQLIVNSGMMGGGAFGSLRNIVLLNIYDKLVQTFPVWSAFASGFCDRRKKYTSNTTSVPSSKSISAEIEFQRLIDDKGSNSRQNSTTSFQNRMDSVIHTISKVKQIHRLLSINSHDYLPNEFDPINVENDVYFQLTEIKHDNGILSNLRFKLFCYEHDAKFLQAYVEQCSATYDRHMLNKLGTNLYFFDMMVQTKDRKTIQNPLPSNYIMFTKHKFQTSRTFENVFFEQRQSVKNHTEFFLNRKDWYEKKGIPHTLGFMFHGEPGCGKTSSIKAIANVAHRHIINVHLSEIKSKEQLRNLFFNDEIHVWDNGKSERYTIPVNERMYVIEDIDAMGDMVLRREWKKPEDFTEKKKKQEDVFGNPVDAKEDENQIDLSFLLNLLDGTLETSGRILAVTTNFPERIDRALIRPGRIDMIIQFKKCSVEILRDMVESFYDEECESELWKDETLNEKWTPAEVNQLLFRNFTNKEKALSELKCLTPTDLYGFEINQPQEILLPICQ